MAPNENLPATDSAAVLHELVGDDATASFENDPKFESSNPTASASSENLQTRADRKEIQSQPSLETQAVADEDDEDEVDEDDDDDDLDDEDEDDEDEDLDDEDEDDEDDDDEEYEDDDDDDDVEDEDDEDEE